jgi:ABC-type bacteriocin/lantibiotic exporter with double-glycine peptidase domain
VPSTTVYRRLRELAAGRTVVLITHRMASVREADRIYVSTTARWSRRVIIGR